MPGIFDNLMQGYANRVLGPDKRAQAQQTADSYARVQQLISDDYANQKATFESNPENKGKEWEAPSPVERMNDQINAMVLSGDPQLQARGLNLVGTIKPKEQATPASIQQYQYAVGQGYGGTYMDYLKATKGGTVINVGGNQRGAYLTTEEKEQGGLDPNAAYTWTKDGPKPVQTSKQSEEQKPINVAETTVGDLNSMLFGDDGLLKNYQSGTEGRLKEVTKANIEAFTQNDPRYKMYQDTVTASLSQLARSLGGEKGALAEGDVQRVQSLMPVVTGWNPDTPAVARQKIARLRNLIKLARQKGGLDSDDIKQYITGYGGQTNKTTPKRQTQKPQQPPVKPGSNDAPPEPGFVWDD